MGVKLLPAPWRIHPFRCSEVQEDFMTALISFIVGLLVAALVIYIVSRLNLGLTVDSFTSAIIAALVIAIVSWVIGWLLGMLGLGAAGGFWGLIIWLLVSAVVLMISDRFLPGMHVRGFSGALIAAVAIGVIYWLLSSLLGGTQLF
jgi:putative membrane protein